MPTYEYNRRTGRYSTPDGQEVAQAAVRAEIHKMIDQAKVDMKALAGEFYAGRIGKDEFEAEMRNLLKAQHIVAASVGKGGRARMRQEDWGRVGGKLKWQYSHLSKFARLVDTGSLSLVAAQARAQSYAHAPFISFSKTFLDTRVEIYTENQGDIDREPVLARLIQNSMEGCDECTDDADEGWVPVEELGEIGSRECGDFCKCDIEFSDEDRPWAIEP